MSALLSSKVLVVEEPPKVRGIAAVPTSVAGAVGVTERGPIGQAVLCTSFEELEQRFGGFTPDSDLALAAMGFFENGGSHLWVVRTVHHADVSDAATATALRASGYLTSPGTPTPARVIGSAAEPFRLADGDRIALSVDGEAEEGVTFNGTAAQVPAAGPGPFALSDGQTLTVRFDGDAEQVVVFAGGEFSDIGDAQAGELAAAINSQIEGGKAVVDVGVLVIASDTEGTASRVEITGGTAASALGFTTGPQPGDGNVGNLRAVTVAEVESLLEAAVSGIAVTRGVAGELEIATTDTGTSATLQILPATASAFGLDTDLHRGEASGAANALRVDGKDPGAYANRIQAEVRAPTSGEAGAFDLAVIEDGVYRERFPNLSMTPGNDRYVETVVNAGSSLIRVIDQLLVGAPVPPPQTAQLAGGDDGLTGLDDADFVGSEAAKTGLHALDRVLDLSLLLVPGRATPAVHQAMVRYCEVDREGMVFAILDPPAGLNATEIVTYVQTTASLLGLTEHAAIYWPRVQVLNPAKSVLGSADRITVPPSGIVAGVYARTDSARPGGVYDPPAGIDKGRMFGVLGFETDEVLEESKRDLVYPKRINPLTTGPGLPRFIDGSRTLKGDGNFAYVAERRGVIFIEKSLKGGLQFARHRNNTEALRAQVRRTITAFLLTQMNNGAFQSKDAKKAFYVDVSDKLNPPSVVFAGKLVARVGLATNKPAEFIELRIAADTRALATELAAAGA